jgi:hypothetical protein
MLEWEGRTCRYIAVDRRRHRYGKQQRNNLLMASANEMAKESQNEPLFKTVLPSISVTNKNECRGHVNRFYNSTNFL